MTKNKNYRNGRAFEYRIMNRLEQDGFIALRTAGSHGEFDCIGVNARCVRLIQAKRHSVAPTKTHILDGVKRMDGVEVITDLQNVEVPDNCTKELWVSYAAKTIKILIL